MPLWRERASAEERRYRSAEEGCGGSERGSEYACCGGICLYDRRTHEKNLVLYATRWEITPKSWGLETLETSKNWVEPNVSVLPLQVGRARNSPLVEVSAWRAAPAAGSVSVRRLHGQPPSRASPASRPASPTANSETSWHSTSEETHLKVLNRCGQLRHERGRILHLSRRNATEVLFRERLCLFV